MGVFDYKSFGLAGSKDLIFDSLALIGSVPSVVRATGDVLGDLTNKIAAYGPTDSLILEKVVDSGWQLLTASTLGYDGVVDAKGTFFGESVGYTTAESQIFGKYDANGKLNELGVVFNGTNDGGDWAYNLSLLTSPAGTATNYVGEAFDGLLGDVARYAQANGLSAADVLVTGLSLGGLAVNSMADLSADYWSGFFKDANYVAFASPAPSPNDKVLNVGYEQDPVFRVLDSYTPRNLQETLGVHDAPQESATNNIVNFNEVYALGSVSEAMFSIINPLAWESHGGGGGFARIADSVFYDLTSKDSTIVVSNLLEATRGSLWVQDLGNYAEPHVGSTFIIGTDTSDSLQGGIGNDYLEGRDGNDNFRDAGGYNVILGGSGNNTLYVQESTNNLSIANDGAGILYIKDAYGGITTTKDVGALVSKESGSLDVMHSVTDQGLLTENSLNDYAASVKGGAGGDILIAQTDGDWMFGQNGDDVLFGSQGSEVFVGGEGNDVTVAGSGNDTLLFSGDFGRDTVFGFQSSDKLVFVGVGDVDEKYNYIDHAQTAGFNTVVTFGDNAVTLVGVGLGNLSLDNFAIA